MFSVDGYREETEMNYAMLALDMDGTLLKSDKTISPATLDALKALAAKGVALTVSTGRNLSEMADYPVLTSLMRYGILNSGAVIWDFQKNEPVFLCLPKPELVRLAMREAERFDTMIHIHAVEETYALAEKIEQMPEYHMAVYQPMFRRRCTAVDDIDACAEQQMDKITKLCIYFRDTDTRELLRARLENEEGDLVYSEATSLEVTAPGVNKALGLEALCRVTGIPAEQCVVAGDGYNDLEILAAAGLAVAMGNANEQVKALCPVTVADNDHDGIVELIRRFF